MDAGVAQSIQQKYALLGEIFNERERRLWAAVEARQLGRGGISTVARATGLSRTTIHEGLSELGDSRSGAGLKRDRVRTAGGGRKTVTEKGSAAAGEFGEIGRADDARGSGVGIALDM
jgi:DNA-binding phage protein